MVIEVADHRPTRTPRTLSVSKKTKRGIRRIVLVRSTGLLRRPQHDRACRAGRKGIVMRFVPPFAESRHSYIDAPNANLSRSAITPDRRLACLHQDLTLFIGRVIILMPLCSNRPALPAARPVDFDRRLTHDGRAPTDVCLGGRILLPILSRPLFANRMTLAVS